MPNKPEGVLPPEPEAAGTTPTGDTPADESAATAATAKSARVWAGAEGWPEWAPLYLEALALSPNKTRAAEKARVDRTAAWKLAQRDESFALAQHDALNEALDLLEETVYVRGTRGLPQKKTVTKTFADGTVETTVTDELHISDTLAMFFLKRWRPEYRESFSVEQSGPGGGPIAVTLVDEVAAEARAELERLAGP